MTKIKKAQPDLTEYWETLTAKYLTLRSNVLPKIGKEFENEELSNILQEKEDSNLTMFRIIRAIYNHVNNKMKNDGESFKILGKGYKENPEEDDQVIQTLLNESQRKPKKFIGTPYPTEAETSRLKRYFIRS